MKPVQVGVIGCGNISEVYFEASRRFEAFEVVACADAVEQRAKEKVELFPFLRAMTVKKLLGDQGIEVVLNLTIPKAHAEVGLAVLQAGKSVYSEKPLAVGRDDAQALLRLAKEKGLKVGCAPDTFLGAGLQTCRKLIDDGWIGKPVSAMGFMACPGHESWHPDPAFYYQHGGGPLFDMGPYYLTAMVHLMGPIRRVAGNCRTTFAQRTITSAGRVGEKIDVMTPTHITADLDFEQGALGTMVMSFDVWGHELPFIEIHGTAGSLSVPDPNTFGGEVRIRTKHGEAWERVPLSHGYAEQSRGIGLADMAMAMRTHRAHRANGDLAYHVLDVMQGILQAAELGRRIDIASTCARPAALPMGLRDGQVE